MASNNKDTIYIDIDEEITGIIDKVQAAEHRIVALVLPKRATVLQSIVNMKLLKRSADDAKKHVVLITSEAGLMPLAGATGLYVAKTLQSKPEVPLAPETDTVDDVADDEVALDNTEEADADNFDQSENAKKSVGELARGEPVPTKPLAGVETLELDNEEAAAAGAAKPDASKAPAAAAAAKKGKNKKLKVPNFNKFRLRLVLAGLVLLLLIAFWVLGFKVLPKATIDVKTNAEAINSSLNLTLDTKADTLDPAQRVLPATVEQDQKTNTQQVPATGQKDEGTKATGSVTLSTADCSGTQPSPVPAGTGVSANGLTFITQQTVSFSPTLSGVNCHYTGSTDVVAQQNGDKYNLSPRSDYKVNSRSDLSGSDSSGMSGGTSKIVKVVSQSDVNAAKQKLESKDSDAVKKELKQRLEQENLYAVEATFSTGSPKVTSSANVGDQADTVTVTEEITYSMYGVKESDLKKLVDDDVKSQIDTAKQTVLDEGLGDAVFKVTDSSSDAVDVSLETTATAGPDLNTDNLKKQVAGKKSGEIKSIIRQNPGVTDVEVHYSPFWVSSAPSNPDKITITFAKPKPANAKGNASSD